MKEDVNIENEEENSKITLDSDGLKIFKDGSLKFGLKNNYVGTMIYTPETGWTYDLMIGKDIDIEKAGE